MLAIHKLSDDDSLRLAATRLYCDAFFDDYSFYCKDRERLSERLAHIFDEQRIFVAVEEGEVVAMLGYSDALGRSSRAALAPLVAHFGLVKGTILYIDLKNSDSKKLRLAPKTAFLESICTRADRRGRGIATALINHVASELAQFDALELDVHTHNSAAQRVYERCGFVKISTRRHKNRMRKILH